MKEVLKKAKEINKGEVEKAGLHLEGVFLFGSRARGDFSKKSDWDFYVIIAEELGFLERARIASKIRWKLARADLTADVFVQSRANVQARKSNPGTLAYYVLKEGTSL
jgi:predicted nucleotidyltransferase